MDFIESESSCIIDEKCNKNYYWEFTIIITINKYEYSLYKRKNNR